MALYRIQVLEGPMHLPELTLFWGPVIILFNIQCWIAQSYQDFFFFKSFDESVSNGNGFVCLLSGWSGEGGVRSLAI